MGTTYFWTDADGDHDFENPIGNNWKTEAGVAAGAGVYPGSVAADNIVFDERAAAAPSVNVDQSASPSGVTLVDVRDGYAFGGGTEAAPLVLKVAGAAVWTFNGEDHGEIWMVGVTAAVTSVRILKTPSPSTATPALLHLVFAGVIATQAEVISGAVRFEKSLLGVTSLGMTTLTMGQAPSGGTPVVYSDAPITTLNRYAGEFTWNEGTIGTLNGYGGLLRCDESLAARTVTTSYNYGGTTNFRTGVAGKVTLTNPIDYKGGEVIFDFGERLQRS